MITDFEAYDSEDESTYSFTNSDVQNEGNIEGQVLVKAKDSELGDFLNPDLPLACQRKKPDPSGVKSRPATSTLRKVDQHNSMLKRDNYQHCKYSAEPVFHVNYDTILKLKDSTRKLLSVLEEIHAKTHSKHLIPDNVSLNFGKLLQPISQSEEIPSVIDIISANAIKKLEVETQALDTIYIQEEADDDCSIYKRLSRKCHCLNHGQYNDFMIHFNEDTKYRTSIAGEIIKNVRILKKFLYMNGSYTKNALLFLNEGLSECTHTEKVEIIQGCAHADICNVFEEQSIVTFYILLPCKNYYYGDVYTQTLTAGFLNKLAQLEEGRRYLNYSSKVTNDIKKILRKKSSFLDFDTVESLSATLNLLNPPMAQNININFYCKPIDKGVGKKTVETLAEYRQTMTLQEVLTHLDLLQHMSDRDTGKVELLTYLPALIILFKRLLIEFDNSEINIIVAKILNNIVTKHVTRENESDSPKTLVIADVGTEPIQMKHQTNQIPLRKNFKKNNNSKLGLGVSPNKFRNPSRRKVTERPNGRADSVQNWGPQASVNRSRKFSRNVTSSIIVVPIEEY